MTFVIPWSRRSARIKRVDDDDDDEHLIYGFLCDATLRALIIGCPGCGALHDIKATDRRSRVFYHQKQQFRRGSARRRIGARNIRRSARRRAGVAVAAARLSRHRAVRYGPARARP